MTKISAGINGRLKAFSTPCPKTKRTYKAAIVQVLPVPADASIKRDPYSGKVRGISAWLVECRAILSVIGSNKSLMLAPPTSRLKHQYLKLKG